MDPDAARTELPAVAHQVVGHRPDRSGVGLDEAGLEVLGVGHGERVVHRLGAAVGAEFVVEHREVGDPQEVEPALGDRRTARARCGAGRGCGGPWDARRRRGRPCRRARRRGQVDDRRAPRSADRNLATPPSRAGASRSPATTRIHARPLAPQSLAWSTRPSICLRVSVAAVLEPDALDARRLEHVGLGLGEDLGELDQLHAEADVGLVGAEALLRLLPGHPGDVADVASRARRAPRPAPQSVTKASTSSWPTNEHSMSSWVNSNWRSARRSSSRRQRAIWK